MSKIKTSMKYIKALYPVVFRCGYCDLQYIYRYDDPTYYNCGVYGWNCDIYVNFKYNAAITTGYRNMRGVRIPDEIINKYTEIAKNILANTFKKPYDEICADLETNKENFWAALMEWYTRS